MEFDKLKKLFQALLLDELYNSRCEDFETELMKAKKAGEEYIEDIGNRFDAILKTIDQKHYDFVSKEQEEIYKQLLSYAEIFGKEYYKLGLVDGFVLKHELSENKVKENNIAFNHKFFDNYDTDYSEFLERYKVNVLYKNKEYKNSIDEEQRLLNEYPKLRDLLENDDIKKLNKDEIKALIKVVRLEDKQRCIEIKHSFKLGIKEGIE